MKYKCFEKRLIYYGNIPITVKELLIKGKPEERYFIYKDGFSTCGGAGWRSLEKMLDRYLFLKWLERLEKDTEAKQKKDDRHFFQ